MGVDSLLKARCQLDLWTKYAPVTFASISLRIDSPRDADDE